MPFFCASYLREVVPVAGGASSHVAVTAKSKRLMAAKEAIVLVSLVAEMSVVGRVLMMRVVKLS